MGYTQKVVIIGAGISGLTCAYRLRQLGVQCLVLEEGARPGGVIATVRRDGCLFELGPQCPRFPASVWRMVQELGLRDEFLAGDPQVKRYIFRYGALHPAPFSPSGLVTTRLVGVLSKLRILTEAMQATRPPSREETLAEFVTRKFGADVLDNLADPIISTLFFGDAYRMGMESAFPALVEWERNHGSLVRGALRARSARNNRNASDDGASTAVSHTHPRSMKITDSLPSLGSFRAGMARLTERLAEELQGGIRYGARVNAMTPTNTSAGWQVGLANGEAITTERIVLAVPAYEAGRVLEDCDPSLGRELRAIEYAAMSGVSLGYERQQVRKNLDGFGFMVPRKEGLKTICTFWNSSLFSGRAPAGRVLLTSFARSDDGTNSDVDARTVEAENASILGITGEATAQHVWCNPRALPQYNVGHSKTVAAIHESVSKLPNLHLTGNYLKGRSIGDCVELAFQVAEKVHSKIAETNIQPPISASKE